MNYYEHHIGDFAQATSHLSFVEDAAYTRLIRKYYAEEKPIPLDLKAAQRLIGARTKEEKEAVQTVLEEFFSCEADGWHSKRCDEEIARYREKQEKARASAQARWEKKSGQKPNADAMRTHAETDANASAQEHANASKTHNERNAHQTPDTRHQTPDKNHSLSPERERLAETPERDDRLDIEGLTGYHPADWQPDTQRLATTLFEAGIPVPAPEVLSIAVDKFNLNWAGKPLTTEDTYKRLRIWLAEDRIREQQRTPIRSDRTAQREQQPRETPVQQAERAHAEYLRQHGLEP